MTLKIVGAGFGRTGTRSLKEALELLGFAPCHHMMEVFMHPEQVPFWDRAAQGQKVDWNEVFANYQSACDWPSCSFAGARRPTNFPSCSSRPSRRPATSSAPRT